ncbi:TIGR02186 family protein [Frigidibacter sp. SD6-1]|uniref:TIGR02186 family protein n=1 Tax=Frigidibacter sp. SD6-1 TaxID=3032581 RepID=UPI0024DFB3A6|nr:TIGR02186 family protein [Frigidibacter sp. SD6-1]
MKRLVLIFFLALAGPLLAEEDVVAGLSQDRIDITANFDGSDILIYGAVKRDAPVPGGTMDVIITLEGPGEAEVVRRKARVFGLWINTDKVVIDRAPSFYAVATTGAFSDIISDTEDLRHAISIPRAIRSVGAPHTIQDAPAFTEALIRIREARHLYSLEQYAVRLTEQTLFRADFDLPANLVEGNYKTRIFLLRDKRVVNLYEKTIFVRKVGLERWLFNLSRQQPAAYGLLALVIAALAGWGASAGFRLLRR